MLVRGRDDGEWVARASAFHTREVGDGLRRFADVVEEAEAVGARGRVVRVDAHVLEERIDRRAELCQRGHGAGEILARDGGGRILHGGGDCASRDFSSGSTRSFASMAPA